MIFYLSLNMEKIVFCFFCLTMAGWITSASESPKIGIIGGGIGGTSCAFFLKSLLPNITIDLYEADKVGGRLSVVDFSHKKYEEGGCIIHPKNKYMVDFLGKLGLKKREKADGYSGLYDGKNFVFSESEWQFVTLYRILARYGFGVFKLKNYIEDTLNKFERIYQLQDAGVAFNSIGSMLYAMDPKLLELMEATTESGFKSDGVSDTIVNEIIMATIRANYGQNLDVPKMVGSVSLAAAIGELWSVHGGNVQIPELLLKKSEANLINLQVISLGKTLTGQIKLKTKPRSDMDEEDNVRFYDVVILATPQTEDTKYRIEFEDFESDIEFLGRYHKTVCTLIDGTLSRKYFPDKSPIVDEILTTKDDVPFNAIGRITPVDYSKSDDGVSNVWKIFTQEKMSEGEVSQLFSRVYNKYEKEWLAYPHYGGPFRNNSFVLAPNLYHVNAIEWVASAMEMSAIGARNVALLVHNEWSRKVQQPTTMSSAKDEL